MDTLTLTRMEMRTIRDSKGGIETVEVSTLAGDTVTACGRLCRHKGNRTWRMHRISARASDHGPENPGGYTPTRNLDTAIGRMVMRLAETQRTPGR